MLCNNFFFCVNNHDIIQICTNVMWDWQYFAKYSPHSNWMWRMFCKILSVPHTIVINLNNVMAFGHWKSFIWSVLIFLMSRGELLRFEMVCWFRSMAGIVWWNLHSLGTRGVVTKGVLPPGWVVVGPSMDIGLVWWLQRPIRAPRACGPMHQRGKFDLDHHHAIYVSNVCEVSRKLRLQGC